jgi:hypothetical protein
MHIGFTGTRSVVTAAQSSTLAHCLSFWLCDGFDTFHHGDCLSADALAHAFASRMGYYVVLHPPTDPRFRAFCQADRSCTPLPYMTRNSEIVAHAHRMIAVSSTPGEVLRSGTWATIRRARRAGLPIEIIYPDGSIH